MAIKYLSVCKTYGQFKRFSHAQTFYFDASKNIFLWYDIVMSLVLISDAYRFV